MKRPTVTSRWLVLGLALSPSVLAGALTYAVYRTTTRGSIEFEKRNEGAFIAGFHGSPHDVTRGYRLTTRNAYVSLTHLPAEGDLRVDVRLRSARPADERVPAVWFTANGREVSAVTVTLATLAREPGVWIHRFRAPLERSELAIGIHAETHLVAGLGPVGVAVLGVSFELPEEQATPLEPALWMAASALVLVVGGLAASRPLQDACIFSGALSAGFLYLLTRDGVRFLPYPQEVFWITALATGSCIGLRALFARWRWVPERERAALAGILALGLLANVTGILHPLFVSSDAVFQANRLQDVLSGDFFPTSVTQHDPPFRIPYPIALYVLAAPWVALGADAVRALQALNVLSQLAATLAVAFLARRFSSSPGSALVAAALYPAVPVLWLAMSAGNLTNLFGVSATLLFLACLVGSRSGSRLALVGVFLFSLAALTSHLSTFLMATVLWPCWLWALRRCYPEGRRFELRLVLGAVGGSALLAVLYYAGYRELVSSQWPRLVEALPTGGDDVRLLSELGARVVFARSWLGDLLLVTAAAGAVGVSMRKAKTELDVAVIGWLVATVLFLALDVTTPLGVRYLLGASPLVALCAADVLSQLFRQGGLARLGARLVLTYLLAVGVWNLGHCILVRYH